MRCQFRPASRLPYGRPRDKPGRRGLDNRTGSSFCTSTWPAGTSATPTSTQKRVVRVRTLIFSARMRAGELSTNPNLPEARILLGRYFSLSCGSPVAAADTRCNVGKHVFECATYHGGAEAGVISCCCLLDGWNNFRSPVNGGRSRMDPDRR